MQRVVAEQLDIRFAEVQADFEQLRKQIDDAYVAGYQTGASDQANLVLQVWASGFCGEQ